MCIFSLICFYSLDVKCFKCQAFSLGRDSIEIFQTSDNANPVSLTKKCFLHLIVRQPNPKIPGTFFSSSTKVVVDVSCGLWEATRSLLGLKSKPSRASLGLVAQHGLVDLNSASSSPLSLTLKLLAGLYPHCPSVCGSLQMPQIMLQLQHPAELMEISAGAVIV